MQDKVVKVCVLIFLWVTLTRQTEVTFADQNSFEPVFQKGMSYRPAPYPNYYSYDTPESDESLRRMAEANVEWVAIITWWFQENLTSTQIYPHLDYTPTNESLKHAVQRAHELGMKVMLKPMVDTEDARNYPRWKISPSPEWFASYRAFISFHAQFAQENGVELLCVGCEFKTTENDSASWLQIISEVRNHYSGPLTYAATFDSYKNITWWNGLDYVGIDAFFPLTNKTDPTLEELKQAWNRTANDIESWHSSMGKPILFTEIGYRSGDGNNKEPWNWTATLELDLQEQYDCYLAAFKILWDKPWFYGFYWWIWESYPNVALPNYDKAYNQTLTDFTPQNKPAQRVISCWYSQFFAEVMDELNTVRNLMHELLANYTELQSKYDSLEAELNDLRWKYGTLMDELNITRNILYAFLMVFIATTVYFAFRMRKRGHLDH